ncbi:MAG: rhodanese-like domain-containing protein [Candidatus Omnitrophica bacterium]|nr:rhodanese-like domain-containing protein [Candidatus Omnitrophota bacterium]
MRKVNIVFAITFAFLAVLPLSYGQDKFNEGKTLIDRNSKLIDVRTEKEYNEGHLKNAINIPHTEIKEKIIKYTPDKEEKIVLYCRSGRRAEIAKTTLLEMGYKNVINAGGYDGLRKIK